MQENSKQEVPDGIFYGHSTLTSIGSNQKYLVVGTLDDEILIFDKISKKCINTIVDSSVFRMHSIFCTEDMIISPSKNGEIKFWKIFEENPVHAVSTQFKYINGLYFYDNCLIVWGKSTMGDCCIALDTLTKKITELCSNARHQGFSAYKSRIAIIQKNCLSVWDLAKQTDKPTICITFSENVKDLKSSSSCVHENFLITVQVKAAQNRLKYPQAEQSFVKFWHPLSGALLFEKIYDFKVRVYANEKCVTVWSKKIVINLNLEPLSADSKLGVTKEEITKYIEKTKENLECKDKRIKLLLKQQ